MGDKLETKCRFHHCSVQAISRIEKAQGCEGARPAGLRQHPALGAVQGSRAVVKTRLDLPDPPSLLESSPSTPGIPKGT